MVCSLFAFIRALELVDVELLHLQHRGHGAIRLACIWVMQHLEQHARHNLPRHTELVLEPAALLRLVVASGGELVPVVVDLFLAFAGDLQGDGLVELEYRASVERGEGLALELERHGQHGAGLSPMDFLPRFAVPSDSNNLRILEDAGVEIGGIFGLAVEPEARCDFGSDLHGTSYS